MKTFLARLWKQTAGPMVIGVAFGRLMLAVWIAAKLWPSPVAALVVIVELLIVAATWRAAVP